MKDTMQAAVGVGDLTIASRFVLARNRRTYPRPISDNLLGQTAVAFSLMVACILMLRFTGFNRAGPILLGIGAAFIVIVLGQGIVADVLNGFGYAKKPGGIIDQKGLTLYGDSGPKFCPWDSFGEVFATTNHGEPILQHLSVADLGRQNYDRYSSYWLTPIDFLEVEPEALAAMIREHPNCPSSSRNQVVVDKSHA